MRTFWEIFGKSVIGILGAVVGSLVILLALLAVGGLVWKFSETIGRTRTGMLICQIAAVPLTLWGAFAFLLGVAQHDWMYRTTLAIGGLCMVVTGALVYYFAGQKRQDMKKDRKG